MKKSILLIMTALLGLSMLLAGCGNRETDQHDGEDIAGSGAISVSEPEASSSSQPETALSSLPDTAPSAEAEESELSEMPEAESNPPVPEEPSAPASSQEADDMERESSGEENSEMKIIVHVNGQDFTATLEENAAAEALVDMMEQGPVTIQMRDYSGFEKVGPLGMSLPTSNQQTTTQAGDIVLYQGNQIVIFYGSNSWSYTRLGHIDDLSGWEEALGTGDVTVTFSLEG